MRPPVSVLALHQPALHQPSVLLSLEPLNLLSPETTLAPINAASEPFVRSLVWTDFRVAVALFVVAPFALLAASVAARVPRTPDDRSRSAETVLRLMTSYWQASSLLLLTVALNIQEANFGVFAGLAAQAISRLEMEATARARVERARASMTERQSSMNTGELIGEEISCTSRMMSMRL